MPHPHPRGRVERRRAPRDERSRLSRWPSVAGSCVPTRRIVRPSCNASGCRWPVSSAARSPRSSRRPRGAPIAGA